jgi:asparagine synthase (glutamine-hydrolysing)
MSAIAGVIWFHGAPAQADAIQMMIARSKSFGPDEQISWLSDSVAMGHCMLRTTPEAAVERMPLTSNDGRFCLVWDGRIDNRDELRRMLFAEGARIRADTDSELVLHSYLVWGSACVRRLLGDFAFAVWDSCKQTLFCVRDPMGARPLYWARTEQFFAFASHEEALVVLPGITGKRYDAGITRLMLEDICMAEDRRPDPSRTWYENVRFMLAGQLAEVNADGHLRLETYWTPEPGVEANYESDRECQDAFLEVFGAATRSRLRASGDIAVLMSGGLDTAAIVAMARRELRELPETKLHAYSFVSDNAQACIETRCIMSMAKEFGDRFHAVSIPSFSGSADVEDLLEEAWPHSHPEDNCIWLQAVLCRAASRNGHRVILQGAHGDLATWAPDRYIAYAMRAGKWRSAWRECRGASTSHNFLKDKSAARLWTENLWTASVPAAVKATVQSLRARGATPRLLNLDFARTLGWRPDRKPRTDPLGHAFKPVQQRHAEALKGLTYSRSAMPRVAGRCGVEARDPWEDKRVVEFFLHLPMKYRVRHGWTKYLVRSTFDDQLDPHVLWRLGKQHLGWDVSAVLLARTHARFSDDLDNPTAHCWKYLDRNAARRSYALYLSTNDLQAAQDVVDMMTLATWLRRIDET